MKILGHDIKWIFFWIPKATKLENLCELNKSVAKRQTELACSLLIEICIGLVTTMPCLSPVAPRKPEAQRKELVMLIKGEKLAPVEPTLRKVNMSWQHSKLGLRRQT